MPTEIANNTNIRAVLANANKQPPIVSSSKDVPVNSAPVNAEPSRQVLPTGNAGVSAEPIEVTVEKLNVQVESLQRNILFSVDKELGRTVITVTDKETDEVIRRIPSEEVLAIARHIQEMLVEDNQVGGLLVEEQA